MTDGISRALKAQEAHAFSVCVQIIKDMKAPNFLASQDAKIGWNMAKEQILEAIQDKADQANQVYQGDQS